MKTKVKILIAASFLICIIAIISPAAAAGSNRIFLTARGDDMDLPGAKNLIIARIELGEGDELTTARVFFHQKLYDESGEMYVMKGRTKNGVLMTDQFAFYCPVVDVFWVNCLWIQGEGKFKTTDTDFEVFFRKSFTITMPNTGGQYVTADIFMWLSPIGAYCGYVGDPTDPTNPPIPTGPVKIWPEGGWALAGVFWDVGIPMDVGFGYGIMPVGPVSYLTRYTEK